MHLLSFISFISRALIAEPIDEEKPPQDPPISTWCDRGPHPSRVAMRHIEGGGIGYNEGYSTLEGFFSLSNSLIVPFIDLRGHIFNDGKYAANAGLGIRRCLNQTVLGINAYYDYRNTRHQNYNQVGFGLEVLGTRWEGRANGYLPVGRKKSSPFDKRTETSSSSTSLKFDSFNDHHLLLSSITTVTTTEKERVEFAMKGVDAEIGCHIFRKKNFDLFLGIGPYYFKGSFDKKALGGKARLTGNFSEYFYLTGIYSNDSLFHSRIQGEAGINIPFGRRKRIKKSENVSCRDAFALRQRLSEPVWRQEIIAVDRHRRILVSQEQITKTAIASNPKTGSPWNFQFVDNTSSSQGTFEDPFPTLVQAQNASAAFDIIYVFPGDGTTTGMDNGIVLKDNQRLWGSGVKQTLPTQFGMVEIPALTSDLPHLTNVNGTIVTLANNNEVSGLRLNRVFIDKFAIFGTSISDATIKNNVITSNVRTIDVSMTNFTGTVNILNNEFKTSSTDNIAISISNNSTSFHVIVDNNTFKGYLFSFLGLSAGTANSRFDLSNNTFVAEKGIPGSFGCGFSVNDTSKNRLTLKNNTFKHFEGAAALLESSHASSLSFKILNNKASLGLITGESSGIEVAMFDDSYQKGKFEGNTIERASQLGLAFVNESSANGTVSFTNNIVKKAGQALPEFFAGIGAAALNDGSLNVSILNNTLVDNLVAGGLVLGEGTGEICLRLLENTSNTGYTLENAGSGVFKLEQGFKTNVGEITTIGPIEIVNKGACDTINKES